MDTRLVYETIQNPDVVFHKYPGSLPIARKNFSQWIYYVVFEKRRNTYKIVTVYYAKVKDNESNI